MRQLRYDESTGIYRDCRWCGGRGCVSCKIEADKAYKAAFPDGPKPIASFTMEDIQAGKLKDFLGPEAIESAAAEARKRAKAKFANIAGFREMLNCTDEEAIDALTVTMLGEVLAERITAAAQ